MDSLADDGALTAFEGRDTAGADMELLDGAIPTVDVKKDDAALYMRG